MIRVGTLPLAPCEEAWLRHRLELAAVQAGRGDFWPMGDMARGVMEYLGLHYPGTAIDLPALIDKIQALLQRVGCGDIAGHLDTSPPPIPLTMPDLAVTAGNGFELIFFRILGQELKAMDEQGVREVALVGLRECVHLLRGTGKWRRDCAELEAEIRSFIRRHGLRLSDE